MNFMDMEKSVYGGDLENDAELLAELAAIQEEELGKAAPTKRAGNVRGGAGGMPGIDQKALAAALADNHDDGNDEELEMDEELLNELAGIVGPGESTSSSSQPPPIPRRSSPLSQSSQAPPPIPSRNIAASNRDESQISHLRQLHSVYSKMLETAKKNGESAKERRYERAVEKLVELISAAEKGKKIDPADIPATPPNFQPDPHPTATVAQPVQHPQGSTMREAAQAPPPIPQRKPSAQAPPTSGTSSSKKDEILRILIHRRDLYVANGKAAIGAHDKESAKEFVTMAKSFDQAISALKQQENADGMDLEEVPPSPKPYRKKEAVPLVQQPVQEAPKPRAPPISAQPATFLEALQHRHQRYLQIAEKAKADGNERKVRMNQRIAGQYAEAIRDAKAGRPVAAAELPKLPDMPELPPQGSGTGSATGSAPRPTQKGPAPGMKPPPEVGPLAPSDSPGKSRNAVQLDFLLQRQNEFKQAAILAKSKGDIDLAKKYLLEAKGFDKMIEAAKAGLPVSIKQTPIPPQAMTSGVTLQPKIQAGGGSGSGSGLVENKGEKLEFLEKVLIEQVKLAQSNQMRFTRLGDVGKVKLFESWAKSSKQDLLLVRAVAQQNLNIPKFHYESRQIPSADLFPDLAEDAFELIITSCRNVPLPSGYEPHHANIFVKYTFPFPNETPQTGKTKTVAGNINPEFGETIMLSIGVGKTRNSKLARAFKRGGLKFEVFQKGGFMRSDKLLGTCEWKLEKLETSAELEDSLPLRDGRKAVGGLLSARVRIREPIGDAKAQTQTHKWLILDN
ncbi:unnamed protein product [Caenorhabditis angaria]|uniref:C2 domain-containing protein n=1 Tax=Caenorhabditis angaria TaxID=860376 RepID=A0A9P1I3T2_9PELO|nr:unnamed protein product [Caenorhabditis angaria]